MIIDFVIKIDFGKTRQTTLSFTSKEDSHISEIYKEDENYHSNNDYISTDNELDDLLENESNESDIELQSSNNNPTLIYSSNDLNLEENNSFIPTKRRKKLTRKTRLKKSYVWNYFKETLPNITTCQLIGCRQDLAYHQSTTAMKTHLAAFHHITKATVEKSQELNQYLVKFIVGTVQPLQL
ncbi:6705_t:CDS:2, partial [Cetraspora pellucida]